VKLDVAPKYSGAHLHVSRSVTGKKCDRQLIGAQQSDPSRDKCERDAAMGIPQKSFHRGEAIRQIMTKTNRRAPY